MLGSPDIYGHEEREVEQSVNFVTCHDGFTLNDLVSYDRKHNDANGENNRDGSDDNLSWNCGVEGPSDEPEVEALRNRQVKNFHVLNLLAAGTPMLTMGDEVRRTQQGNNNAYCQNSPISWFDWTLLEKHDDIRRFVKQLIAVRLSQTQDRSDDDTLLARLQETQVEFHGVTLGAPDEGETSHSLAISRQSRDGMFCLYLMINAYWEPLAFELPPFPDTNTRVWRRWIDTSCPSPDDICSWTAAPNVTESRYRVGPRSVVALVALADQPVAHSVQESR
jgi:glycogen operon protein